MRGVIYARYSSDNQREESIEGQLRENTAYAKKNGIEIVGTYIDRAVSTKTDNRPELQRMIKDSAKNGFDVVIVWKLDRFCPQSLRLRKIQGCIAVQAIAYTKMTVQSFDHTAILFILFGFRFLR